jgi:hypothetical protein
MLPHKYNHAQRKFRDFTYTYGTKDAEYNHTGKVTARSSLEAGSIIINDRLINPNYTLKELLDPADRRR